MHHKLCVEIEVLLCLSSFCSALKLFVPLQFSNRGTSVAAYYNRDFIGCSSQVFAVEIQKITVGPGFHSSAVTREFPVSHCPDVGFFGLDFASLELFMNTFQERPFVY